MKSFKDYLSEAEQVSEKSVSKSQQRAAGIALAAKRGDMPKSKLKGASKEMSKMSTKDLEDFAKTKHKGLPKKVKEDGPDKADIPAYKRKEKGGDWKVSQKDLDDKEASTMTTHAGLKKREKEMQGVAEGGLTEGVLTDSVGDTMAHIMQTFGPEVKKFVATDELDDDLYNALYDYYFDDMPYGVKKARSGDPYEWVADRFYDYLKDQGMVEETVEAPVDNTELDDLARLAGLR